ncbi:MAG: hypothetical protein EA369_00145 [Bradymonadales bacterium]|nr:MAG: hypothetical protein EA369_00145 [Bradymonadales bacterium]
MQRALGNFGRICSLLFSGFLILGCSLKQADLSESEKSSQDSLKVAVVQYPIEGNRGVADFSQKIEDFVQEAVSGNADLVIFPEYVSLDLWRLGSGLTEQQMTRQIAEAFENFYPELLVRLALENEIWIIGGSYPRIVQSRMYNSSPIISPKGEIFFQDKIFLTPWEREVGLSKGNQISLIRGPWGLGAVLICYDVEIPELAQRLSPLSKRLNVLFVPSMTESPEGLQRVLKTSAARAVEHHSFVVVSATVGAPSPTWRHYGKSSVYTPETKGHPGTLVSADYGAPGIHFTDLDLALIRKTKESAGIYPVRDQLRFPARNLRLKVVHPVL